MTLFRDLISISILENPAFRSRKSGDVAGHSGSFPGFFSLLPALSGECSDNPGNKPENSGKMLDHTGSKPNNSGKIPDSAVNEPKHSGNSGKAGKNAGLFGKNTEVSVGNAGFSLENAFFSGDKIEIRSPESVTRKFTLPNNLA